MRTVSSIVNKEVNAQAEKREWDENWLRVAAIWAHKESHSASASSLLCLLPTLPPPYSAPIHVPAPCEYNDEKARVHIMIKTPMCI